MEYLCEACAAIFADGSVDRYAIGDLSWPDSDRPIIWHAHHPSAVAHRDAVSRGCIPCLWIPLPDDNEYRTFFCIRDPYVHRIDYTIYLGQPPRKQSEHHPPNDYRQSPTPPPPDLVSSHISSAEQHRLTLLSVRRFWPRPCKRPAGRTNYSPSASVLEQAALPENQRRYG